MFIKFKNSEEKYSTNTPVEQKLFKGGVSHGWLLSLTFFGKLGSTEVDELITEDNISEITVMADAGESNVLTGYNKVNSCVIKHAEERNTIEIQLSKELTSEV